MHPRMYHCNAAPGSTRSGRLPTPPDCYLSTVAYIVAALPPSLFFLYSDDRGLATSVPAVRLEWLCHTADLCTHHALHSACMPTTLGAVKCSTGRPLACRFCPAVCRA
eukprot:3386385-Pleurochrysis_carterae.AAC.1